MLRDKITRQLQWGRITGQLRIAPRRAFSGKYRPTEAILGDPRTIGHLDSAIQHCKSQLCCGIQKMQIVWKNYAAHLLEVIRIWFFFFAFQLVLLSCILKSDFLRYNCRISFFLKSDFLRYNCGIYQGQHNWTTSKTSIALIRNKTLEQHISVKTKKI